MATELFGCELTDDLPENGIVTRAVVVLEVVMPDGEPTLKVMESDMTQWDVIGMLAAADILARIDMKDAWAEGNSE